MLTEAEDVEFWKTLHKITVCNKDRIEELKAMFKRGIDYANEIAKLEGGI